jgi:hypothetical protein
VLPSRSPITKSACASPGKSVAWLAAMAGIEWQLMWMAVAVARMRLVHRLRHGRVVRAPAAVDALAHLGHRQLPLVDRQALVGQLPDQALAQAHLRQHARVGGDGVGPVAVEHRGVDLGGVAVGVEVAARKERLDPRHAQLGREVVELLDVRVLGAAQRGQLAHGAEVVGVDGAAVRGVEHQRRMPGNARHLGAGLDQFQDWMHRQVRVSPIGRARIRRPSSSSRSRWRSAW